MVFKNMEKVYEVRVFSFGEWSSLGKGHKITLTTEGGAEVLVTTELSSWRIPRAVLDLVAERKERFIGSIPNPMPNLPNEPHIISFFYVVAEKIKTEKIQTDESPSPYDLSDPRHPANLTKREL